MIAITFALPTESSLLVSRLKNRRRVSSASGDIILGEINSRSIAIFHTGVGRKICEARAASFLREQNPDVLISSGFAGAVGQGSEAGDLFLAENFSEKNLLAIARKAAGGARLQIGKLFTSPLIVDLETERNQIARMQGADAVDMETEVIAQACEKNGTPMLSLRVISDTPRDSFPAPPSVLFDIDRQRTNVPAIVAHFIVRPIALMRLVRFARQINRARTNLTDALIRLLGDDSLGRNV